MSMVGTFDGFTAARLGIYAAQHGLRVTGNNVSNINTAGYTRQRADQISFKAGANDMYKSWYDNHVGSGALVNRISQLRDPYLDIRYRNASTDTYHYDTWLAGMQNIASILDEVGKGDNKDGLIYKAIQDLAEKLRAYSANPTSLNDRLVRNSAESLTLLFHNAAGRLEKLYNETQQQFTEDVSAVNEILTNIRDLNKSIRDAEIHGDTALEMRDERNRQIDALSQYLDIKVEYSYENIGGGVEVEKLTIKLNDANPDNAVHSDESILVDGVYATQLSVPEERPVLNTFSEEYPYLGNSRYLKKISADEAQKLVDALNEKKGLTEDDEGYLTLDDLLQAWDENGDPLVDADGNPIYLIGTGDPDVKNIFTEANDNFSIQLSKLLNSKGEEWKSTTTAWVEVSAATAAANAKFSFPAAITRDENTQYPLTVTINGKTVTVAGDDTVTDEAIVAAIAAALNDDPDMYPGYEITSSGTNIIFRVADPENPPENPATLSFEPGTPDWLSIGDRESIPAKEYDEHGNVIKSVEYVQLNGKWYELTIGTTYSHEVTLDDNDLHGILQAERELLTEEGEFASAKDVSLDESALIKRGIPYYIKSLDLLAQKFAEAYNQLNTGYAYNQDGYYIDADGNVLMLEDIADLDDQGNPIAKPVSIDGLTDGQKANLDNNTYTLESWLEEKGLKMGGELFTQLDGETTEGITAKNISISHGWSNGLWNLVPTFKMLFTDSGGLTHSTQNDNADHMVAMIDKALTYNPRDLFGSDAIGPELFNGSFNDMLSNMMAVEGEDASITSVRLTTYSTALTELDYSREGVSGVDLNDEAMNMITYSKAMSAAMRVMTTIDEMLDRLINNTAV